MARTKADVAKKAGGKAARKIHVLRNETGSTKGGKGKSDKYSGGNPYCPRPTPEWQKPITGFFSKKPNNGNTSEEEKVENSLTFSDEKMESNTSFEESNQNGFLENGVQEEGNSNGSANNSDEESSEEDINQPTCSKYIKRKKVSSAENV